MTKKQQQVEIVRLNQDLTELTGMYEKVCVIANEYRDEVACLKDKVRMQEEFYKMDKTEILELEAQLALAKLRLHRTTERANMLQKTIDGISFSM